MNTEDKYAYAFGVMIGKENAPEWREYEQQEADEEGVDPSCHIYLTEHEWEILQTDGWITIKGTNWEFEAEARY